MKRVIFVGILMLLVSMSAMAQDNDTVGADIEIFGADIEIFGADIEIFGTLVGNISYMFTQEANGSLDENADGTYTLELYNVPNEVTILQIAPPGAIDDLLATFVLNWQTAIDGSVDDSGTPTLQVAAELQTREHIALLVVTGVSYDEVRETMSYTVELAHITPQIDGVEFDIESLTSTDVPKFDLSGFENGLLTIAATQDFWDSVSDAAARSIAVRDSGSVSSASCAEAQDALENSDDLSATAIYNINKYIETNCN